MNTAKVSTLPDVPLSQTGPANEARPTPPTPHGATLANFALFDLGILQLAPRIRGLGKIISYRTGREQVPARYRSALLLALAAIAFELLAMARIHRQFFGAGFLSSFVSVTPGGAIIAALGAVS